MRLSKITYHIGFKNDAHKFEKQQHQIEQTAKSQPTAGGKRYSGSYSIYSNSNCGSARGSGSGSGSGVSGGAATNNRSSIGNGSCVSSSTTSASTAAAASVKRRKSKSSKFFGSTVFRCCLPCRGGGSAAPATSPPNSPVSPADDINNGTAIIAIQKKYAKAVHDKKRDSDTIGAPFAELDTDVDVDVDQEAAAIAANGKKHSLADTIATSATTPLSLKTLINDGDDELEAPPLSAVDIAAATLATGILARKAEPETLSDASVSPTAAIQQLPHFGVHFSAVHGNALSVSVANAAQQISPTKSTSQVPAVTSFATAIGHANTATTLQQQQQQQQNQQPPPPGAQSAPRVSQSQTSPLPHIKEEEESEHIGNRQQYSPSADAEPNAVGISDSSESTNAAQSTNTSFSAPTSGGAGGSSTCHCHQELITQSASTPSPRIKLKFRKQHKSSWPRSALVPNNAAGSSAVGGGSSSVGGGSGNGGVGGGGSGSVGDTSNETLASNGSITNTATSVSSGGLQRISLSSVQHASSSQLLPATKMQAEQGSIGDLQKYHSRYLKNRRHTLANVR